MNIQYFDAAPSLRMPLNPYQSLPIPAGALSSLSSNPRPHVKRQRTFSSELPPQLLRLFAPSHG
ncbi:hypothetical protein BC826DRAFT_994766 [Russula brevipes]|nr:hypothetical protein BC826DRAFT_1088255 [Russula brevipes]KAI0299496.1 hypothetical protein BC826DRAFT_994766 [Russula brevipes]